MNGTAQRRRSAAKTPQATGTACQFIHAYHCALRFAHDVRYDFNSLTYGIAQSLALAEYLGHLILTGSQPFDATDSFDPLRYSNKHTAE